MVVLIDAPPPPPPAKACRAAPAADWYAALALDVVVAYALLAAAPMPYCCSKLAAACFAASEGPLLVLDTHKLNAWEKKKIVRVPKKKKKEMRI